MEISSKWFKAAAYHLRHRSAPTGFKWTKGHAGTPGNDQVDALANLGADKLDTDATDTNTPDNFKLQGVELTTITQALAYRLQIDRHLARTTKQSPASRQTTKYT